MAWPYVSDAEFDRHLHKMNSDILGAGALAQHLLTDIGKLDAEGRPEKGCTLWWFIAHLEPTATRITQVRKELVQALSRGRHGTEAVQALGHRWLGDAVAMIRKDPHLPQDQRALLSKMIEAASAALEGWAKDPDFVGNQHFMARPGARRDFISDDFNERGHRLYSTKDDAWVERNYPLAERPKGRVRTTKARPPTTRAETRASSRIADLEQRDAVRALLAADVLEMVGDRPPPEGLVDELAGEAGAEVAGLFGMSEARRALFLRATGTVADAYADGIPAQIAKETLQSLGITTREVRAFRANLASGLVSAASSSGAAIVGGRSFVEAQAELQVLTDDIDAKRRVDPGDIEAIRAFTDGLDLATIHDAQPDYVTLMQRIFYHAGMDTPESAELEPIYYHALNTCDELVATRAKAKLHTPWAEARQTFLQWVEAEHADEADIHALLEKMDPKDVKKEQMFLNGEIGIIALKKHGFTNDAAAEAFRRPLWDLVARIADQL